MHDVLSVVKDALGVAATVAIAVPWLRDYKARRLRSDVASFPVEGGLKRVVDGLQRRLTRRINEPKPQDLLLMITGFALLGLSFLISLATSCSSR